MAKGISVAASVLMLVALAGCGEENSPAAPQSPQAPPPAPADFTLSVPAAATLNKGRKSLTSTVTSEGGATVVDLSCVDPPDGVPCEFSPSQVNVPAGGSATSNLRFDIAFLATPGAYTVEVSGTGTGSVTRSSEVELTITEACSGFTEQASYTGNACGKGLGICLGFGDGYVEFAAGERYISGWSTFSCGTYTVVVGHGSQTDYQHPQGTNYLKHVSR